MAVADDENASDASRVTFGQSKQATRQVVAVPENSRGGVDDLLLTRQGHRLVVAADDADAVVFAVESRLDTDSLPAGSIDPRLRLTLLVACFGGVLLGLDQSLFEVVGTLLPTGRPGGVLACLAPCRRIGQGRVDSFGKRFMRQAYSRDVAYRVQPLQRRRHRRQVGGEILVRLERIARPRQLALHVRHEPDREPFVDAGQVFVRNAAGEVDVGQCLQRGNVHAVLHGSGEHERNVMATPGERCHEPLVHPLVDLPDKAGHARATWQVGVDPVEDRVSG